MLMRVEMNVWPKNDLIIFPGLVTLEPEQESPPDGESTPAVWGSRGTDTWRVRNEAEHARWKLRDECWLDARKGGKIQLGDSTNPFIHGSFLHGSDVNVLFPITCSCYYYYCVISSANMEFHKAPLLAFFFFFLHTWPRCHPCVLILLFSKNMLASPLNMFFCCFFFFIPGFPLSPVNTKTIEWTSTKDDSWLSLGPINELD